MIASRFLRNTVILVKIERTTNEYGELQLSYTNLKRIKVEVVTSEFSSNIVSDGENIEGTKTFRMRYTRDIRKSPDIALRFDGDLYEITNVENVKERNKELIVNAANYIQD